MTAQLLLSRECMVPPPSSPLLLLPPSSRAVRPSRGRYGSLSGNCPFQTSKSGHVMNWHLRKPLLALSTATCTLGAAA